MHINSLRVACQVLEVHINSLRVIASQVLEVHINSLRVSQPGARGAHKQPAPPQSGIVVTMITVFLCRRNDGLLTSKLAGRSFSLSVGGS